MPENDPGGRTESGHTHAEDQPNDFALLDTQPLATGPREAEIPSAEEYYQRLDSDVRGVGAGIGSGESPHDTKLLAKLVGARGLDADSLLAHSSPEGTAAGIGYLQTLDQLRVMVLTSAEYLARDPASGAEAVTLVDGARPDATGLRTAVKEFSRILGAHPVEATSYAYQPRSPNSRVLGTLITGVNLVESHALGPDGEQLTSLSLQRLPPLSPDVGPDDIPQELPAVDGSSGPGAQHENLPSSQRYPNYRASSVEHTMPMRAVEAESQPAVDYYTDEVARLDKLVEGGSTARRGLHRLLERINLRAAETPNHVMPDELYSPPAELETRRRVSDALLPIANTIDPPRNRGNVLQPPILESRGSLGRADIATIRTLEAILGAPANEDLQAPSADRSRDRRTTAPTAFEGFSLRYDHLAATGGDEPEPERLQLSLVPDRVADGTLVDHTPPDRITAGKEKKKAGRGIVSKWFRRGKHAR